MAVDPVSDWLTGFGIYFCCFIANTYILHSELLTRRSRDNTILFTTKWSRLCSITCIICGTLQLLCSALQYFPIACYFVWKTAFIVGSLQATLMGFYQLDRLYYCFSQSNTHTDKAYPFYVFMLLSIYGAILTFLPFSLWYLIDIKHGKCGIDRSFKFHDSFNRRKETLNAFFLIAFGYQIWDLLTLCLYAYKVCMLRKRLQSAKERKAEQRAMRILQRILMLTFLYEIPVLLYAIVAVLYSLYFSVQRAGVWPLLVFASAAGSMSMSYSMYLMQQYNIKGYRQFLVVLQRLRLQYLCCFCCLKMIAEEIEQYSIEKEASSTIQRVENNQDAELQCAQRMEDTVHETRSMGSVKMEHSKIVELSVETTHI